MNLRRINVLAINFAYVEDVVSDPACTDTVLAFFQGDRTLAQSTVVVIVK
jgi:hypothetical protein